MRMSGSIKGLRGIAACMQDCKLNAIADMVHGFAAIVEGTTRPVSDLPEEELLHSVAALYQTRASSAHPSC